MAKAENVTIQNWRKVAALPKIVHPTPQVRAIGSQRGFTLIDLLFVIGLIGLLSSLAVPALSRAKGSAYASSALGTLRVVNSAQLSFAITCGLGFYAPDLPALGKMPPLSTQAFLSSDLASAVTVMRSGYSFTVRGTALAGTPPTCNGLGAGQTTPGYVAIADPLDPLATPRFFGTNADGVVYEHSATLDGKMPEAGVPAVGTPIQK